MSGPQDFDLEAKSVLKRFGDHVAVDALSFGVRRGSFFSILGPSGCGKTTLLRMIAGFIEPDGGDIEIGGRSMRGVAPNRRPVNMVFQQLALFPMMSVGENVAYGLARRGVGRAEREAKAQTMLERVGLPGAAGKRTDELSGGQRQRVAIARSLVLEPTLLLLDEPLGALDLKLREEMQLELIKLQREVGVTFVFVTHAQPEALALSHRIAVMNQGRIEQLDTPSRIYSFPSNRFVADFIGNCNLLEATVTECRDGRLRLSAAGLGEILAPAGERNQAGDKGVLALRPEQVRIGDSAEAENQFPGTVRDFLYAGDVTTYQVALDNGHQLAALRPNDAPGRARFFEIGDRVTASWAADAGHYVRD